MNRLRLSFLHYEIFPKCGLVVKIGALVLRVCLWLVACFLLVDFIFHFLDFHSVHVSRGTFDMSVAARQLTHVYVADLRKDTLPSLNGKAMGELPAHTRHP